MMQLSRSSILEVHLVRTAGPYIMAQSRQTESSLTCLVCATTGLMHRSRIAPSFDHVVSTRKQRESNIEAEHHSEVLAKTVEVGAGGVRQSYLH